MIQIERRDLTVMMEAGYVLLGMQRYKDAFEVFEGVSIMAPDSDVPLVAQGSVKFCEGKFSDAMKLYKDALKIDPESLYAMAYTGEALFFMGKKKDAVKMLQDVNKTDPDGRAGDFARAFLDAVDKGFDPDMLSGHKEVRKYADKKERSHKNS